MAVSLISSSPPRRARLTPLTILHHTANLLPMILVHAGVIGIFFTDFEWWEWLAFPAMTYIRGFFLTAGYHRYFSHRSFKTSRVFQFIMAVFCCANLQQGPIWWAAYHRRHHTHSDTTGDPHSPFHGGFLWAYCGWLFIPLDPEWNTVSDLRRYPELVWLERFWQVPGLLLAALCWWIGGWSFLFIGFCLSAVVIFHMAFVVNTISHLFGSRRYETEDHSRNSFLLAMITMGDGWHNNHHHFPNAAQAGFFRWEIDGCFRLIVLLEKLGIVWGVRRIPEHKLDPKSAAKYSPPDESDINPDMPQVDTDAAPVATPDSAPRVTV